MNNVIDKLLTALRLIAEVDDEYRHLAKPVGLNVVKLLKDAEQRLNFHYCVLCQLTVPWPRQTNVELQQHHISGKVRAEPHCLDVVAVCNFCHARLSDHQRDWLIHRNGTPTRLSCYFFGWADIFDLLAYKSGYSYFEKIASRFRAQGYYIRNRITPSNRRPSTVDLILT